MQLESKKSGIAGQAGWIEFNSSEPCMYERAERKETSVSVDAESGHCADQGCRSAPSNSVGECRTHTPESCRPRISPPIGPQRAAVPAPQPDPSMPAAAANAVAAAVCAPGESGR